MAMIRRLGTTSEKFQLEMTIHSVHVNLDVPCALKVVIKRGKHKCETQELRYSMQSGVVFFEQEVKMPVTLYKRGSSYQEKPIEFRLVRVVGDHYFKDGKGAMDLNGVATTGVPVFREDVPLKKSLDKDAVVCVSLDLIKQSDDDVPPIRSQKHAATAPPVRMPEANRTGLRIDPVHVPVDVDADSTEDYRTPMTAGPTSTYFSPEARGREWSPVSEQIPTINSLYGSPDVPHSHREDPKESPGTEGALSPASAPLKSILSRPDSKKAAPVLKKSVSLRFEEEEDPDSPLLKLVKVVEAQEDEDPYEKKSLTSSSSEEEAPCPESEHRDEEELSDGEKEAKDAQERKRAFRLDLSKSEGPASQGFTNGEDTSSDEEPVLVSSRPVGPPSTSLKTAVPNQQSKERAIAREERKTGMQATNGRSAACSGCTLQ